MMEAIHFSENYRSRVKNKNQNIYQKLKNCVTYYVKIHQNFEKLHFQYVCVLFCFLRMTFIRNAHSFLLNILPITFKACAEVLDM
jgi:hypothetical protein